MGASSSCTRIGGSQSENISWINRRCTVYSDRGQLPSKDGIRIHWIRSGLRLKSLHISGACFLSVKSSHPSLEIQPTAALAPNNGLFRMVSQSRTCLNETSRVYLIRIGRTNLSSMLFFTVAAIVTIQAAPDRGQDMIHCFKIVPMFSEEFFDVQRCWCIQ